MIKYKATYWSSSPTIEEVRVVSETAKFVVAEFLRRDGSAYQVREAKSATDHAYFDDWGSAKEFLLGRCNESLAKCRRSLQRAHDRLGSVKGMKPPAQEDAA